jgi:DNA invertase Pin-like site-specific DNA recombinase
MILGYARTSTDDQEAGFAAQQRELAAIKIDKLFSEKISSIGPRPQLEAALDYLRDGDTLVVTKLDRLARSVADLCNIVKRIEAKGASLRILAMGVDTATPTGRLILNVIGSIAQFEREIMLERQREGIAKAKGEGKYKGRAPTARAKSEDVLRLAATSMPKKRIADELGIGIASVWRILADAKEQAAA